MLAVTIFLPVFEAAPSHIWTALSSWVCQGCNTRCQGGARAATQGAMGVPGLQHKVSWGWPGLQHKVSGCCNTSSSHSMDLGETPPCNKKFQTQATTKGSLKSLFEHDLKPPFDFFPNKRRFFCDGFPNTVRQVAPSYCLLSSASQLGNGIPKPLIFSCISQTIAEAT